MTAGPAYRFCTVVRVEDGQAAEIVDVSSVDEGHRFGLTADGRFCHLEGMPEPGSAWWPGHPVIGGFWRGSMTETYPSGRLVSVHTPEIPPASDVPAGP